LVMTVDLEHLKENLNGEQINGEAANDRSVPKASAPQNGSTLYKYEHLKPVFDTTTYPPLTPFQHEDPGHRALKHENDVSFLNRATRVQEMTLVIGTEVEGVKLIDLTI